MNEKSFYLEGFCRRLFYLYKIGNYWYADAFNLQATNNALKDDWHEINST
ncbi:MAG: hypothetical protein AAF846_18875 [Chloroflexota bacterium]